jgi:5-methylcytosine-specific restriction protein A
MGGSADKRLSGRRAMARNARILAHNPLCVICVREGRTTVAVEVDHIVPLHKGGADDESNLAGICKSCHAAKTAADLGHKPKPRYGLDGWPTS